MRNRLILITLCIFGCTQDQEPARIVTTEADTKPIGRNPKIPVEISYPIIDDNEEYNPFNKKRTVNVRLNQKVSPSTLREIALEIKSSERHQYERTFIWYHLPQKYGVDSPPWATSHFNPTLNVEIMGLTKEDEEKLRGVPLDQYETLIGAWLIDGFGGHLAVLYEAEGDLKLDRVSQGGKATADMEEVPSEKGRRFKRKKTGGDIYEVAPSGVLRLYEPNGKLLSENDPSN